MPIQYLMHEEKPAALEAMTIQIGHTPESLLG
jgi:hypothetical protein